MRSRPKLLRLALLATALSLALAPPSARRSSARQSEGPARGAVGIRVEDGKEVKLYEKSYALVVGVSDYTHGWPKLPGVKKDIDEVSRVLERHGFQVTNVENPDSAQLEKSFKEFIDARGRGVETRLLFYFAGHGHTVKQSYGEEMGYIVPRDAPLPARDPSGFMSKAMDMQQMELYARRVQSKHALFVFDSCFSGAIFALSRAVPDAISYKTARPVRQFITSGSADEQVPDQSIFRRQFVEALGGEADLNNDDYVTGTELGMFLQDKVINYSRDAQHPQYGKIRHPNLDKGDFVFALPKAPPPPPVAAAKPTPLPSAPPSPDGPMMVELAFWDTIKNSDDPEDYKDYLAKYPAGQFAPIARRRSQPAAAAKEVSTEPSGPPSPKFVPVRLRVPAGLTLNGRTYSGVAVKEGQRIRITATGQISMGGKRFSTPAGLPRVVDHGKPMRNEPFGLLIAIISDSDIGNDNDKFIAVGPTREVYAPRSGRLFLAVNEENLNDNTGSYDVLVEVESLAP